MTHSSHPPTEIHRPTLYLMAIAAGLAVANLYYCQPLLRDMALEFHVPESQGGYIAALTQAGYGAGLLLIVPLGDMLERRRLVLVTLATTVFTLIAVALAPGFRFLATVSFLVGFTSVTPQLLVPFAVHLAPPAERGRVVGTVMSGLLSGILLSRTVSGFVGQYLGWRAMYWIAAAITVGLILVLRPALPKSVAHSRIRYLALMASLRELLRDEPVLRQSCLFGAGTFGAFSAFWATLAFHLAQPPFGYGSQIVGLFGVIGIVGVFAASFVGRLGDRSDPRLTVGLGILITILSFVLFRLLGDSLTALIIGVILMDLGAQTAHISNQTRIFSLRPEARNRLNTVYMVSYFVGGGVGAFLGAWGWSRWGWHGVCLVGILMPLLGFLVFLRTCGPALLASRKEGVTGGEGGL